MYTSKNKPNSGDAFNPDSVTLAEQQKNLKDERYQQNTKYRKLFSNWVLWLNSIYLVIVLIIVFLSGFEILKLSSGVLTSILCTTTANVLGLTAIILRGMFRKG